MLKAVFKWKSTVTLVAFTFSSRTQVPPGFRTGRVFALTLAVQIVYNCLSSSFSTSTFANEEACAEPPAAQAVG